MPAGLALPPRLFVTGTDTGIGKTVSAAVLAGALHAAYGKVSYVKVVESGAPRHKGDAAFVASRGPAGIETATLFSFKFPASPHLAASLENKVLRRNELLGKCRKQLSRQGALLLEGAGGLFVPLNQKFLVIDLIAELTLPVVLVGRAGLGTLNHTLLSLEALRSRNISVARIILNSTKKDENLKVTKDNRQYIEKNSGIKTLILPRFPDKASISRFNGII